MKNGESYLDVWSVIGDNGHERSKRGDTCFAKRHFICTFDGKLMYEELINSFSTLFSKQQARLALMELKVKGINRTFIPRNK